MIRVIIAGILGGAVIFFCGFVEHAIVFLQTRGFQGLPDEVAFVEQLKTQKLEHGVYVFPEMPKGDTPEAREASEKEMAEKYKTGPNGLLFIGRTNEEPMTPRELGIEFGSNVAAAVLCSFILALMSPRNGFATRLCVCFLIGLIAWLSIEVSYGVWYRFHSIWVIDSLIGSLAEWLIAGVLMSAIVKPFYPETAPTTK